MGDAIALRASPDQFVLRSSPDQLLASPDQLDHQFVIIKVKLIVESKNISSVVPICAAAEKILNFLPIFKDFQPIFCNANF